MGLRSPNDPPATAGGTDPVFFTFEKLGLIRMNRNTLNADRRRRKLITVAWALGLTAVVIALIYFERADVLYILCTLGVAVLLMVVAIADLAHGEAKTALAPETDAAGVASKER